MRRSNHGQPGRRRSMAGCLKGTGQTGHQVRRALAIVESRLRYAWRDRGRLRLCAPVGFAILVHRQNRHIGVRLQPLAQHDPD